MGLMQQHTTGSNALLPHGVNPSKNYYLQGRINQTLDTPGFPDADAPKLQPWGQVFRVDGTELDADVLVKVRNLRLYTLSKATKRWTRVHDLVRVNGRQFPENYDGDAIDATDYSADPSPRIVQLVEGRTYHFWGTQTMVTPSDIGGLIVSYEAKLVSLSGADVTESARDTIIAGTGLDEYTTEGVGVGDIWVGSFVPLTTSYRKVYGTSLTTSQFMDYPPPAELLQLSQTDAQTLDPDIVEP